ncbi:hypothetical protein ACWF95_36845 [Streptomyces vinaceus]
MSHSALRSPRLPEPCEQPGTPTPPPHALWPGSPWSKGTRQADDALLGAAIVAHMAFNPGWTGQRQAATEHMVSARTYGRRGQARVHFVAWLDAVEAECATRCGDTRAALDLISHAESVVEDTDGRPTPEWMDWFLSRPRFDLHKREADRV